MPVIRQNATITGLVIYDIPGIEKSIGSYPTGGLYWVEKLEESKKEEAKKKIYDLLKDFKNHCSKEKVNYNEAEEQGSPSTKKIRTYCNGKRFSD